MKYSQNMVECAFSKGVRMIILVIQETIFELFRQLECGLKSSALGRDTLLTSSNLCDTVPSTFWMYNVNANAALCIMKRFVLKHRQRVRVGP